MVGLGRRGWALTGPTVELVLLERGEVLVQFCGEDAATRILSEQGESK